jgi:hypothetical protein
MHFFQKSFLFLLVIFASGLVQASACTYREAIMALERGNTTRGMALMRMANRDGDKRAGDYLIMNYVITKSDQSETLAIDSPQKPLISLNRVEP